MPSNRQAGGYQRLDGGQIDGLPRPPSYHHPLLRPPPPSQPSSSSSHDSSTNKPRSETRQSTVLSLPSSSSNSTTVVEHESYPPTPRKTSIVPSLRNEFHPHHPIPATTVFARDAPPLYLPRLDSYLSSLSPPPFKPGDGATKSTLFQPFDVLAKMRASLDDLEHNTLQPQSSFTRSEIASVAVSIILGATGSSALATFYYLQGFMNTLQIFALIVSTVAHPHNNDTVDQWRNLFLGKIPNILALNWATGMVEHIVFLLVFMSIASALLYYFYRSSVHCDRFNRSEGLQQVATKGSQWGILLATFFLTILYLPLSTMALRVIVWSQDLWLEIPGSPDSVDLCWTTTLEKNQVNFAPVVIIVAIVVFLLFTIGFPLTLHRVIRESIPKVDPYTELGRRRNVVDMDTEYHHLLDRDTNPFTFLYSGYRREWASFQTLSLVSKLSTLVIVTLMDPSNCLFRSVSQTPLLIARQALLLVCTTGFFAMQCYSVPFLDPVNNASEWLSRLNYVMTALVALFSSVRLSVNDSVIYLIYVITYSFSIYFIIINTKFAQHLIKKLTRRLDFSIDIFSPQLDISPTSPHIKRRVWQEALSVLFLTDKQCRIPPDQKILYSISRDSSFPPYLLNFRGTPGERYVENLKILREVGSYAYQRASLLSTGPDYPDMRRLYDEIQRHFVGPDCYWQNPEDAPSKYGHARFFGNAWWIPFPPTLVFSYDNGSCSVIQDRSQLELYVEQNSSHRVKRKREIRLALRALDGQVVSWPYRHTESAGPQFWAWGLKHFRAASTSLFHRCILKVKQHGYLKWKGMNLGSGFTVELKYNRRITVGGEVIGLDDDFDLTSPLAHFFALNKKLISSRIDLVRTALSEYRHHHYRECQSKAHTLSYSFLSHVYDYPHDPSHRLAKERTSGLDPRVRELMVNNEDVMRLGYDRFLAVTASDLTVWWYLFWDDLWRRNHDSISAFKTYASDIDPHYPSSIAYTPLPRPILESFLVQRGLLSAVPRKTDILTSGLLNKIYLRLNEIQFKGEIHFHLGDRSTELEMNSIDAETMINPSSLGTGGGTDHDASAIIARPAYRWESLLSDPMSHRSHPRRIFLGKLGTWLGLTPVWKSSHLSLGIGLDVRLQDGKFVLLDERGR